MPLRYARFLVTGLIFGPLLSPILDACSVPQFYPGRAAGSASVEQLIDGNHLRRALALLSAAPAQGGRYAFVLSRVQLGLSQFGPALESAEKALAADPQNASFHVQVAAVAGRMAEHASMFKQLSLAKRVRKELEDALVLEPKNADALYGMVLYSDLAPSFLGGDKARALKLADQLTLISAARGYLTQAMLAETRKDARAQEAFLEKAVAADPQSYDARVALAIFKSKSQPVQLAQADEQACKAVYIDPTRAEAWQILAELAVSSSSLLEVEGLLWVFQGFNPDDLSPAYHAAVSLIGSGKSLDAAQSMLQRYLELPPEGNSPSAGLAHFQLALIAEKQGHPEHALELLRTAVSEDPTAEEARKELKRLEHPGHAEPAHAQPTHAQ